MDSPYNSHSINLPPTSPSLSPTTKSVHLTLAQKVELATLAKKLLNQQDLIFKVFYYFDVNNSFRKTCIRITHSEWFEILTQLAILVNCIMLAMYDPLAPRNAPPRNNIVEWGEIGAQIYFTFEMFIKLMALGAYGKGPSGNYTGYFNDPWHFLDSGVVILTWLSFLPEFTFSNALRALRVIRPIRWISTVPSLRAVVSSILHAIPALGNVVLLAFFTLLIFGVIGVQLWAGLLRGHCAYEDINTPGNYISLKPDVFCALSCADQQVEDCSDTYGDECHPQLIFDVYNSTDNTTKGMILPTYCKINDNPGYGFISFDDSAHAAMTVLTGITLEGWSDSMYATYHAWGLRWFVVIYWVIVVTFGAYFLLQLALAVIWDSYQNNHVTEEQRADKVIFTNASTLITYLRTRRKQIRGEAGYFALIKNWIALCFGYRSNLLDGPIGSTRNRIGAASRFVSTYINVQVLNLLGGESNRNLNISNRDFNTSQSKLSSPPIRANENTPRRSSIVTMDGQIIPTGVGNAGSGRRASVTRRSSVTRRNSLTGQNEAGVGGRRSSLTKSTRRASLSMLDNKDGKVKSANDASHEAIEALLLHLLPPPVIKTEYPPRWPAFHRITSSSNFSLFFVGVIVANTIVLAMPYAHMPDDYTHDLEIANDFFTSLFVFELILYLVSDGPKRYFSKSLNILDFFIVVISILDILVGTFLGAAAGFGLTALRTLRLARVLKLAKAWADLRLLLQTIMKSLVHVWAAVAILIVVEFVFALLMMRLFGGGFQAAYNSGQIDVLPRFSYDDLWSSFLSVFQTTTGENWNSQLIAGNNAFGPLYVVIMILLYIIGNFFFLNLFLAILLGSFEVQMEAEKERMYQQMLAELEQKQLEETMRKSIEDRARKNLNVTNKNIELNDPNEKKTLQRKATFFARVLNHSGDDVNDDDDDNNDEPRSSTSNFTMDQIRKKSGSPKLLSRVARTNSSQRINSRDSSTKSLSASKNDIPTEILPNTPFNKEVSDSLLYENSNNKNLHTNTNSIPTTANDEPIHIRDESPANVPSLKLNKQLPLIGNSHSTSDPPPLSATNSKRELPEEEHKVVSPNRRASIGGQKSAKALIGRLRNSIVGPMSGGNALIVEDQESQPNEKQNSPSDGTTSTSSMLKSLPRTSIIASPTSPDNTIFPSQMQHAPRQPTPPHHLDNNTFSPPRRSSLLQAAEGMPVPITSVRDRRRSILKTTSTVNGPSSTSPEQTTSPSHPPISDHSHPISSPISPPMNIRIPVSSPPHSYPQHQAANTSDADTSVIHHQPQRGRSSIYDSSDKGFSPPPFLSQSSTQRSLSVESEIASKGSGVKSRRKLALRYKSEAAQSGWSAAQLRKQASKKLLQNSSPNSSTRGVNVTGSGSPIAHHRGSIAGIARRSSVARRSSNASQGRGSITGGVGLNPASPPHDSPHNSVDSPSLRSDINGSQQQEDGVVELRMKGGQVQDLVTTLTGEGGHQVTVKVLASGDVQLESAALNVTYDARKHGAETPFEIAARNSYHKLKIDEFLAPHEFTAQELQEFPDLKDSRFFYTWDQYSLFTFSPESRVRSIMAMILSHRYFENFLLFIILISSLNLALDEPRVQTCKNIPYGEPDSCYLLYLYLNYSDIVIIALFILEMIFKIIVFGAFFPLQIGYLRDPWNLLDFFVVIVTILSLSLERASSQLRALRSLRAIRALRPLRVLSRFPSLKLVVNSMLTAIPKASTVIIINFLFMFMIAIIGLQNFAGETNSCNDPSIITMDQCIGEWYLTGENCQLLPHDSLVVDCALNGTGVAFPRLWAPAPRNCDNIFRALLTVFETAAGEGWPDIMYQFMDTVGFDQPRVRNSNPAAGIFFIVVQLCCGFFLLELFTGVIIANYYYLKNEATGSGVLTDLQRQWVEHMQLVMQLDTIKFMERPNLENYPWIIRRLRALFFRISRSRFLELGIMGVIVLNTVVLAFHHTSENNAMYLFQLYANYIFVAIYVLEALIKIIGYGARQYFTVWWNRFDFALAATSVVSLITNIGPLASMFRIFRVIRIVRLVRISRGLLVLLRTLIVSLPALFNVGVVFAILLFIFAVIGMNLFSGVRRDTNNILNDDTNFDNFFTSVLTLFRSATGENYNGIMHALEVQPPYCYPEDTDGFKANCGDPVKPGLFFTVFIGLSTFMLIKLLSAVVLDSFSDMIAAEIEDEEGYKLTPDRLEAYRGAWAVCDPTGTKLLPDWALVKLVTLLPHPLGVRNGPVVNSGTPLRKAAFTLLSEIDLPPTADGRYQFHAVLQELLRHASRGKAVPSMRLQLTGKSAATDNLGFNLKDSIAAMRVQSVIRSKMARRRVFAIMEERRRRLAEGKEKEQFNLIAAFRKGQILRAFGKKHDDDKDLLPFRTNVKVIKAATVLDEDDENSNHGNTTEDSNESPKVSNPNQSMNNMKKTQSFFQFRL